jgi:hypothetical protein
MKDQFKILFHIDEKIPAGLEGKTINEVFDIVRAKNHEIIERLKKDHGAIEDLNYDDQMYLRIAQTFRELAAGNMTNVKITRSSPYFNPLNPDVPLSELLK